MKERVQRNFEMMHRQTDLIPTEFEDKLWSDRVESPIQLCDTMLFLLGINLGLRAGDKYYNLRRDSPGKLSQLSFERDRCLVYKEDNVTKTNDGGFRNMKKKCKVYVHLPQFQCNKVSCEVGR